MAKRTKSRFGKELLFNKKTLAVLAIVAVIAIGALKNPFTNSSGQTDSSAATADPKPAIFFVPHQDDETLTMGASIIEHLFAGRQVYVVLVGDGTATSVTGKLCKESTSGGKAELAKFCASDGPRLVGEARDREFAAAVNRLGVPPSNVMYEHKAEAKVAIHDIQEMFDRYIARFGTSASYITMSWLDADSDHYNLGYALNSRCVETGPAAKRIAPQLADCRFYQSAIYDPASPSDWFKTRDRVPTPPGGYYTANTSTKQARLKAAIAEYKLNDWANGRYGIGYRSVGEQFDYLGGKMRSHWHKSSDAWTSSSAMAESVRFSARHQFSPREY